MATRKLTAATMFDTLEVDLWGNEYTLRQVTRSTADRLNDAQANATALQDVEDAQPDDVAASIINLIDILLAPKGDGPTAATVLTELWDGDELGLDWLVAFSQGLQEEANQRRRPTSPRKTSS